MYYRYKSKKQSGKKIKVIAITLILVSFLFIMYKYKDYLQIWKYSIHKIEKQITRAENLKISSQKKELYLKAVSMCDDYEDGNPLSPDAYYLESRAWVGIAEIDAGNDFSAIITDNKKSSLSESVKSAFKKALQSANKGMSLDQRSRPDDKTLIVIAKSYFYLDYYNSDETRKVLDQIRNPLILKNEDRKFYGLMRIIGGEPDEGVKYLAESAGIQGNIEGKLFIASAYGLAKQYTNAIITYKSILESAPPADVSVKAYLGLAIIYLTQQLSADALAQCGQVLKTDADNTAAKELQAKIYLAMGDKASAKKIANELISKGFETKELKDIISLP